MTPAKTVLTIHDLSSVGRCALTVCMPALSAAGTQCVPLPTAVLSTHTGGFQGMARRDLTDYMKEAAAHWKGLGLRFDAIYTGYLSDPAQGEVVLDLIEYARAQGDALVLVDPAMGDDGALYHSIDPAMPQVMRELCRRADVATPNQTEALILCGEDPAGALTSEVEAKRLFEGIGARDWVVTGAKIGEAGDLFAAVLLGRILTGESLMEAAAFAARFVEGAVEDTIETGTQARMGLQFERRLYQLAPGT